MILQNIKGIEGNKNIKYQVGNQVADDQKEHDSIFELFSQFNSSHYDDSINEKEPSHLEFVPVCEWAMHETLKKSTNSVQAHLNDEAL